MYASISVLVVCVCVCMALEELPWWKTAILYQVYPRSFKDSNGDGVGDLKGIIEKAEYLKEVGVTAIWISPIFQSPLADFGYDISDFKRIDPQFGNLEDFKLLSAKLRKLDIKLLLDLVPNHSSDEHEWFQKSVNKEPGYEDFYVWADAKSDPDTGKRQPPNNWISVFSGPAWEWNETRGQYYLHQFVKKQPDLNYRNPAVLKAMDEVILFWLDAGVDGFRVDAVPFLFEDPELRNEPAVEGTSGATFGELQHIYTQNLPETFDTLKHWADIVYEYNKKDGIERALFVEAYADLPTTIKYYGSGTRSLMQPFNFQLLTSGNQATKSDQMKDIIMGYLQALPKENTPNWVIGNHDNHRVATNYGPEMVDAMNLLTGVLPGIKVVYNGEEFGMQDTYIRWDQTVDPSGLLLGPDHYQEASRDPERTPMQWDSSVSAGFSSNTSTWLPVNPNYWWLNVAAQRAAQASHLKVFQAMARVRQDPVLLHGDLQVEADNNTLLVIRKLNDTKIALVMNMGSEVIQYTKSNFFSKHGLDQKLYIVISSINYRNKEKIITNGHLTLRPKGAILLQNRSPSSAFSLSSTLSLVLVGVLWHFFGPRLV